jgi:hypothetical protein
MQTIKNLLWLLDVNFWNESMTVAQQQLLLFMYFDTTDFSWCAVLFTRHYSVHFITVIDTFYSFNSTFVWRFAWLGIRWRHNTLVSNKLLCYQEALGKTWNFRILQLLGRIVKMVTFQLFEVVESWNTSFNSFKILVVRWLKSYIWIIIFTHIKNFSFHIIWSFNFVCMASGLFFLMADSLISCFHSRIALELYWHTVQCHHCHCYIFLCLFCLTCELWSLHMIFATHFMIPIWVRKFFSNAS